MATYSGKFSINSAYTLYLDVSESSYDIVANTSVVAWTLRAHSDKALQYGSWDYNDSETVYAVYINGSRVTNVGAQKDYDFRNYKDLTVASGTTTVAHNEDGTKVVACSASYCASGSPIGTASVSGNFTLTTIPRASDVTCTSPAVMASTQSVVVTQKSTSFSHILYYSTDGGTTYTEIGRDTATHTYSWTLPDITSTIPNTDNATYILKCETYTNSTYEGTALESTLNIVATVPSSYVPTIGLTSITEGNTAIPATFPFLVGFSKFAVRTTFTGSANSTCAGRAVQVGNEIITNTSSTSVVDMQFVNALASTSVNVLATATDSRGRQGTATQTVSAYAYQNPNIAVDLTRADSNGNADPLGEYLQVRAKWFYDGVNNLNSATIKIYLDETLEYTYTPSVSSQTEWTDICLLDDIYASSQFDFVATIEDLLLTASVSQTVSKAILPLSPYDDGTDVGVTIGRMSTGPGFRSALDNYFVSGTETHLMDTDGRQVIDTMTTDDLFNKQDTLVSGINIKTINSNSILGSGDIPISGGIYDSGTNTNGNWVKFSDGTMICWHALTVTDQAINTPYTSGHYTGNRTLTFPQTFIDVPVPLLSKFRWGTSASWVPFANCTESTIQIYAMDTVSRATGTNVYISYAVIGRWK